MSARDWLERRAGGAARLYDSVVGPLDASRLSPARQALVAGLAGDVVELGCGTGAAFEHYPAEAHVTAIEPEPAFRDAAAARAATARATIRVVAGDAHDLPFDDGSFDTVVAELTLCSVARPDVVLREAARVLRVDGELRLLEHVRHQTPWIASLQDAVDPLWTALEGRGCRLGRDTPGAVTDAGFRLLSVAPVTLPPGAGWFFPIVMVRARRPL